MKPIIFVTGNLDKVKYTSKFTHHQFEHKKLDLEEIQSLDLVEITEHKVKQAYKIMESPVLVEDTSLIFNTLGNLPGTFIKWFQAELKNEGLCRLLDSIVDKSAQATVCYGFFDGKKIHTFIGRTEGLICDKPRGDNGMGWDSIFIPNGATKTYAEMADDEIGLFSPRRKALEELDKFLKNYKNNP